MYCAVAVEECGKSDTKHDETEEENTTMNREIDKRL